MSDPDVTRDPDGLYPDEPPLMPDGDESETASLAPNEDPDS